MNLRNVLLKLFEKNSNVHSSLGIQDADLGEQKTERLINADGKICKAQTVYVLSRSVMFIQILNLEPLRQADLNTS